MGSMNLKDRLQAFSAPTHLTARRSDQAYRATLELARGEIERHVEQHTNFLNEGTQDAAIKCRLVRDSIQHWIRRYQQYVIQEGSKPHYCEVGADQEGIFEHLLPVAVVRDLVLTATLTIDEALHSPTCLLTVESDQRLRSMGLVKSTPDAYHFGQRYKDAGIDLLFNIGKAKVDLDSWTLEQHFRHFGLSGDELAEAS